MLSKSKYVTGLQCHKRLWLQKKRPELQPPVSESIQARFDVGHKVGELAQKLFPGGREMKFPSDGDFSAMLKATREELDHGASAIYEAAFSEDQVLALCDILVKTDTGFDCYEVKSSTGVKSYHLDDAAIQYYVLNKAGLPIERMHILTLNPSYYMDGEEWVLEDLFLVHDVTQSAKDKQDAIPIQLNAMKAILRVDCEPNLDIGPHCDHPFECELKSHCWPELPKPSIFDIPRLGEKVWPLYRDGKIALGDLKAEDLSPKQWDYVNGQIKGIEKLNQPKVKAWLEELEFPLFFLDFETIAPALPLYSHTRPYQPHLAVQYSLHVMESPEAEVKHFEYLADFSIDYREDIASSLIHLLRDKGTILAYNEGFEKACIRRMKDWSPHLSDALESLLNRFKDLIVPFRKGWYNKPAMLGRSSIKKVYPALFSDSELQYDALAISDGTKASISLLAMAEMDVNPFNNTQFKDIAQDLLAYCKLDTLAMVKIYQHLNEIAAGDKLLFHKDIDYVVDHYEAEYEELIDIIAAHDPQALITLGGTKWEYDLEVNTIIVRLKQVMTLSETLDIIYEEFCHWFGGPEGVGEKQELYSLGKEIHSWASHIAASS